MKLIVQIPCFNEEYTLPATIRDLPRTLTGIDEIEYLVIDDASTDNTATIAKELGVHHVVRNHRNMGLARTFARGLDECIRLGADIIVNTDGDNQYRGADIEKLVTPIISQNADMVIGDRQTHTIAHFSRAKKALQWLGSGIVRRLAGIWVPDTVSGFRAFSREAALKLNILSNFSFTVETVIQAGKRNINIVSVPVRTNGVTRPSRLYGSIAGYIAQQVITIIRVYAMYEPLRVFLWFGCALIFIGGLPVARFLYDFFTSGGSGHIQSLVLGGVLLMMGSIAIIAGLVADLISVNRRLNESTLARIRLLEDSLAANYRKLNSQ